MRSQSRIPSHWRKRFKVHVPRTSMPLNLLLLCQKRCCRNSKIMIWRCHFLHLFKLSAQDRRTTKELFRATTVRQLPWEEHDGSTIWMKRCTINLLLKSPQDRKDYSIISKEQVKRMTCEYVHGRRYCHQFHQFFFRFRQIDKLINNRRTWRQPFP